MIEQITRAEVAAYKREILEATVLVTVDVAAEILSVSTKTVHKIIEEGHLTPYDRRGRVTPGVRLRAAELPLYVKKIRVTFNE